MIDQIKAGGGGGGGEQQGGRLMFEKAINRALVSSIPLRDLFDVLRIECNGAEAIFLIQAILGGDLPCALGINIDDDKDGEPSMIDAYKECEAEWVLKSAERRRSRTAA